MTRLPRVWLALLPAGVLALCLWPLQAHLRAATTVFSDAFTEAASVALTSHSPTGGCGSWSTFSDTSSATANASGNDYAGADGNDNTDGHVLFVEATLCASLSGDYNVQWVLPSGFWTLTSADAAGGVIFGMNGSDYCGFYWVGNSSLRLVKNISGTGTDVATSGAITVAATDTLRLELRGNVFTGYQNGVSRVTWTDSSNECLASRRIGIGWGAFRTGSSTDIRTNNGIDDFLVEDAATVVSGPPKGSLSLVGVGK